MTEEELREPQNEPWFERAVSNLEDLEELAEYTRLLKTPEQQRIEKGIYT